jgi:hypothetical protein
MLLAEFDRLAYKSLLFTGLRRIEVHKRQNGYIEVSRVIQITRVPDTSPDDSFKSETVIFESPNLQLPKWLIVTADVNIPDNFKIDLREKYDMQHLLPMHIAAVLDSGQQLEHNLFCTLPLPVTTPFAAHISAPLILEQERRNVRIDNDRSGIESKYNQWLLSSELPRLYLCLLERLLQIQNVNTEWWPAMNGRDTNVPSQIFMNAFWRSAVLKKSPRRVFVSNYGPPATLSSTDVVLFCKDSNKYTACRLTLSKILSIAGPPNTAELPDHLFQCATKAGLRSVDGPFVKELLVDLPIQMLEIGEIETLLRYLLDEKVSLDGLQIPLGDGSYTTIRSQYTKTNYVVGPQQTAAYDLFKAGGRLVHRDFKTPQHLLELGLNVSSLDEAGVVELVEEHIAPAQEFLGDEMLRTWIDSFWEAKLVVSLECVSHLPLIPTIKPSYFISITRISDPSVTVIDADMSEGIDYGILLKLGMTIVLRRHVPNALLVLGEKKSTPYRSFLEYVQKYQAKAFEEILSLNSSDQDQLAHWARSKFSHTPPDLVDVARKLPIWYVEQRARPTQLAPLNDVIVLPRSMRSDSLRPFIDDYDTIIDWDTNMGDVTEDVGVALQISELLRKRISPGTIVRSQANRRSYKQLIKAFLKFPMVEGYSLLVPNDKWVLTPVNSLFERHELFLAAFQTTPERLIPTDFQDLAESLGEYGLNLSCRLDLAMFIECAKAFAEDDEEDSDGDKEINCELSDRRRRSEILYKHFNALSLQYLTDVVLCNELDQLKFIPRDSSTRTGYEWINIKKFTRGDILSPGKIVLANYEAICWSQRGRVEHQPNPALCGTYRNLGKPTGKEVASIHVFFIDFNSHSGFYKQVKHLVILAELSQKHGRCSALLSDLKVTYKWLNENIDKIHFDIKNVYSEAIFLNVDDPDSDPWVWHSVSTLVKDLQDVGDLHDVKGFLWNYDNLLKAAGVRTIHKTMAEPVAVMDRTSIHRSRFRQLRDRGSEVNVTVKAMDDQHEILPVHKTWMIMNSEHFWEKFITSESEPGTSKDMEIDVPDHSSLCVKEVIGAY